MTVPTVEEIVQDIEDDQASMLPGQKSMDRLTGHYLANLTVAAAIKDCYQQNDDSVARINILKATGSDLDAIVAPVLIGGRLLGMYATGIVLFETGSAASSDITIPAGTVVYAILEDATKIYFKTTAAGAISTGQTQTNIAAQAVDRGLGGNIGPYQIIEIQTRITGITNVSNPLEFSGGTLDETDDELRQRYFDKIQTVGKATALMIQRSLLDLADVSEAKIINHGSGDFSVLVNYSGGIAADSQDIIDCIETSGGAGNVARGTLAATIDNGVANILPDDVYGGWVYIRPRNHVLTQDSFSFTYKNMANIEETGAVLLPAGTRRKTMVKASLLDSNERAKAILSVTPSVSGIDYDILLGMGAENHLYNLPEQIIVSIAAHIRITDTPEVNLLDNIRTSWNAFLSHFYMGDPLRYSDVIRFMNNMYDTTQDENIGRAIKGVKELVSLTVTGGGQSAYRIGDEISVEEDWQIVTSDDISITVDA